MPPVQDSTVASILPAASKAVRTAWARLPISDKGQPDGGRALRGNALAPAGEAQPFCRRRLDADLVGTQARDLGDAGDHLGAVRADFRALADDGDVQMGHDAAALPHAVDRVLQEDGAVG